MRIVRLIACFTVCCVLSLSINAQRDFVKEGDKAFNNESFFSATELYKKAEPRVKPAQKAYVNFQIGECYRLLVDPEQAETYYNRALKLKYESTNPLVYLHLADVLKEQGNYKDARKMYESFLTVVPGHKEAMNGAESCMKAMTWLTEPTRHIVMAEIQLNTEAYDYAPAWGDKKHSELIFSSSRKGSTGDEVDPRTGESYMDLWITSRDNKGKWGEPVPLPATINTEDNEGGAVLTRKADEIYFTRCPRPKKDGNKGCEIYHSTKQGNGWKQAELIKIKPEGADSLSCGHPTLTSSEDVLIFAADLPGGHGGKDLWYMKYDKREKTWSAPVNLGGVINTGGDEMFPHVAEDGGLYFSSTGHVGMGGLDIFKADAAGELKWENVTNLRYPINSSEHDYGLIFERGGTTRGFFTSNRVGGKGKDDLYSFNLPDIKFSLETYVKNKETNAPVPGVTIQLVGTDGSTVSKTTDEEGKIILEEEAGKRFIVKEVNYTLEASRENYLAAKADFSTVGATTGRRFVEEIFITEVIKDKPIDFPEVQYIYDQAEFIITAEVNSTDSLNVLYQTLIDNPSIIIELQAHTDCRGADDYNQRLSQRRAEKCVQYLISKGIDPVRMVPVGKGEKVPRAPGLECATIEKMPTKEEQEAAHQRNRRTQFTVLSFDYKPKAPQGTPSE